MWRFYWNNHPVLDTMSCRPVYRDPTQPDGFCFLGLVATSIFLRDTPDEVCRNGSKLSKVCRTCESPAGGRFINRG
ncbi:MAG: hypothetical protein LBR26_10670 [Prevotella sp.]|nr:hypothetical protein [Prevotella sp.]